MGANLSSNKFYDCYYSCFNIITSSIFYYCDFFFPIVIFLYSKFIYFRREDTEAPIKEGFLVGLYWSVIAIIYDIILVVYILGVGWEFFSSWALLVHYAEIVVFTVLGALTEKE